MSLARIRRVPKVKPDYRIALRPDDDGLLDDVVIRDVAMFRLERMDTAAWWMCCYMDVGLVERVDFWIRRNGKAVEVTVTDYPRGDYSYEPGSM